MWLTTVTVWLFSREGVAKSPCKRGSEGGIYSWEQLLFLLQTGITESHMHHDTLGSSKERGHIYGQQVDLTRCKQILHFDKSPVVYSHRNQEQQPKH